MPMERLTNMFVRPADANRDLPWYAVERDFGLSALRLFNEAEMVLRYRTEEMHKRFVAMGGPTDFDEAGRQWTEVRKALLNFVGQCRGERYDEEEDEWVAIPAEEQRVSWEKALGDLESSCDRLALDFVLSLVGHFALDVFFYAERENQRQALPVADSYVELIALHHKLHFTQFPTESPVPGVSKILRDSIKAALWSGQTPRTISVMVDQILAEESSKID